MIDLPAEQNQTTKWVSDLNTLALLPSGNMQDWLAKPYILSHALRKVCSNIQLRLIAQSADTVFADEKFCLDVAQASDNYVRKIILHADNDLYIFARTIIPAKTYAAFEKEMQQIGTHFIGEYLLYNREDVVRDEFEFSFMTANMPMRQELKQVLPVRHFDETLWARRSCFWIKQFPLLITELFLQEMPAYPE